MRIVVPVLIVAGVLLAGCETFRAHDAGRSEAADKALESAEALSERTAGVFLPMEENLRQAWAAQDGARALAVAHDRETFEAAFPDWTAEELGVRLADTMDDRANALITLAFIKEQAATAVNTQMDRQMAITNVSGEKGENENPRDSLAAIERIKRRLDWLEGNLDKAEKVATKSSVLSGIGTAAADLKGFLKKADGALSDVEADNDLAAARVLLKETVSEATAFEKERLAEYKRHLRSLTDIESQLKVRDELITCQVTVPVVYQVIDSVSQETFERLQTGINASLSYSCPEVNAAPSQESKAAWTSGKSLAGFVAHTFENDPEQASGAAELAGALGILLFHEQAFAETLELEAAREFHKHSVLISEINARQRAGLVHQLTQAIDIYYKGGVRPEMVAQLLVMLGQVGALSAIAAN